MYNNENDEWWVPFQSLWQLDNKEWVAERREHWGLIRQSLDENGRESELSMRGLRNFVTTGYVFSEKPVWPDLDGVNREMDVSIVHRMLLAPFTEERHYTDYLRAILIKDPNDRYLAGMMSPFSSIGIFHKYTGLADEKTRQIYEYILGGGEFKDNKVLLGHERALKAYSPATRIESYFTYLANILKLKGREKYYHEMRYMVPMFEYFTSIAEHLCENEEKYSRSIEIRKRDYKKIYDQFRHSTPIEEPWARELYEKSCDFLNGDRLPKALRYG